MSVETNGFIIAMNRISDRYTNYESAIWVSVIERLINAHRNEVDELIKEVFGEK